MTVHSLPVQVQSPPFDLTCVPMLRRDIPNILEIESVSFSHPWRKQDFVYALEKEHGVCRVCYLDRLVIGYAIGFRTGREFHLADFAIRPECQRRGYGGELLNILLDELGTLGVCVVTLEVRQSNKSAVRLYGRAGFQTIAFRRSYYTRPIEDAVVMLKPLEGKLANWIPSAQEETLRMSESD